MLLILRHYVFGSTHQFASSGGGCTRNQSTGGGWISRGRDLRDQSWPLGAGSGKNRTFGGWTSSPVQLGPLGSSHSGAHRPRKAPHLFCRADGLERFAHSSDGRVASYREACARAHAV